MNSSTSLRLCVHAALPYGLLLGLGIFGIAGWLPVPRPGLGAEEIAAMFQRDQTLIRIGMTILVASSVLYWPFAVAVSTMLGRIEGREHPFADLQRSCAAGSVIAVLIPGYVWLALAYRPELTSPATMQLANDFAWLCFVGMFAPATLQAIVIGVCILRADVSNTVYPRWLGFMNLWMAVLFMPGALLPFFKTGPFAWNGLISFWLVATAFFTWILIMWWATLKAIARGDGRA